MTERPAELARYAELTGDQALARSAGHAAFIESAAREVVTQCMCGQLPALEPTAVPTVTMAELAPALGACEACGAEAGEECRPMCIGQAAHLDAIGVDLTEGTSSPSSLGTLRKVTVFEPCEHHAGMYASVSRYRRAEVILEGGWGGSLCPGPKCRMRPGTDFYTADFVAANPIFTVGAAPQ